MKTKTIKNNKEKIMFVSDIVVAILCIVVTEISIKDNTLFGAFTGYFPMVCADKLYHVTFNTPAPGVILYYVREIKGDTADAFANYPSRAFNKRKKDTEYVSVTVIGLGISVCAGAGLVTCIFDLASTKTSPKVKTH